MIGPINLSSICNKDLIEWFINSERFQKLNLKRPLQATGSVVTHELGGKRLQEICLSHIYRLILRVVVDCILHFKMNIANNYAFRYALCSSPVRPFHIHHFIHHES